MKRTLFILALLTSFCVSLLAQVGHPRRDLAVGISGGYVMNKMDFSPSIKQGMHGGLTFGGTVRYTCEKYFSLICAIQAEANYSQMGWKEIIETSSDTYERTMNYVQVPVLGYMGIGRERGGLRGYLVLGPQFGFCLSESEKMGGEWSEETLALRPNRVTAQYGKSVENRFEYGLTGGLGMEVSTRNGLHFLIEGRYFFALSDIFANSKKDPFGRSANGGIYVKASVLFDVLKTR